MNVLARAFARQPLDSTLAVMDPRTMDEVIADGMTDTRLQAWLLGSFAVWPRARRRRAVTA